MKFRDVLVVQQWDRNTWNPTRDFEVEDLDKATIFATHLSKDKHDVVELAAYEDGKQIALSELME